MFVGPKGLSKGCCYAEERKNFPKFLKGNRAHVPCLPYDLRRKRQRLNQTLPIATSVKPSRRKARRRHHLRACEAGGKLGSAESSESQGEGRGLGGLESGNFEDILHSSATEATSRVLKRIETLSVIGAFLISVSYLLHLVRKARADRRLELKREKRSSSRRLEKVVKVQSGPVGEFSTTRENTSTQFSFLIQLQVLALCMAFLCNLVAKRFQSRTAAHTRAGETETETETETGRGGKTRKIVKAKASSSTRIDDIWRAVARLNRHQSRHSVKQRITRRALEQQLETLTQKNVATNQALVEYSKEFRRLQNEVSQVYAVVAGLESAMRSQLDLISKLAEGRGASDEKERKSSLGKEDFSANSKMELQPEELEPRKNCLQHEICQCLMKSSSFDSPTPARTGTHISAALAPSSASGIGKNTLQKVIGSTLSRSSKRFLIQKQSKMPNVYVEKGQGWSIYHFD